MAFSQVWEWRRLPGTTIEQDPAALPINNWGKDGAGGTDFAGGVSDGEFGLAAFHFKESGCNKNVEAKKGWFFFEDGYLALGSGIQAATATHPVVTTINQSLLRTPITYDKQGKQFSWPEGEDAAAGITAVYHDKLGYLILDAGGTVRVDSKMQSGSWDRIEKSRTKDVVNKKVFNLLLDHGRDFKNKTYAYAIFPDMTVEQWNAIAMEPPFTIRANTPNVQGVWHKALNMGMAVFYEAGSIRLKDDLEITTDTPIMLIWRESGDSIRLSLASPLYKSDQVVLKVSRTLEGEGVRHDEQQGRSSLHVTLPGGEAAGSSVVLNVKGASL